MGSHRIGLCALSVVVVGVVTIGTLAPGAGADQGGDEAQFVQLINELRASKSLPPLQVDPGLVTIARQWSTHMASDEGISHNPAFSDQVTAYNTHWRKLGENVGMGGSVQALHDAFVNSPHHYENLVDPDFTKVGIGVAYDSGGTIFVTEDFMALAPQAIAASPRPRPRPPTPTTQPAPPRTARPVPARSRTRPRPTPAPNVLASDTKAAAPAPVALPPAAFPPAALPTFRTPASSTTARDHARVVIALALLLLVLSGAAGWVVRGFLGPRTAQRP